MSLLALLSRAYLPPRSFSIPTRAAAPRLCTDGGDVKGEEDWRDVRARLVAMEQLEQADPDAPPGLSSPVVSGAPVYETPLIERGSVILGGTQQEFGFALRQQYFHKSVMLLLQHDDAFTRGIILNRPSAMELDGWRVWFGGDVAEGGLFHGNGRAGGTREIVCLHSLTSDAATRLSMPVIRGVQYTTLEGAQALVASGEAERSSFWLFVGYAGWAPKQLQGEVERDSWCAGSPNPSPSPSSSRAKSRETRGAAAAAPERQPRGELTGAARKTGTSPQPTRRCCCASSSGRAPTSLRLHMCMCMCMCVCPSECNS